MTQPHTHQEQVPQQQAPQENSWTGYAAVKYGFIFLIVLAILWFVGAYVLDMF
jgi:hypothetical protein